MEDTNTFFFQSKNDVAEIKGFEHPVAQELAVAMLAKLRESIAEILKEQKIEDNFIVTFELLAPRLEEEEVALDKDSEEETEE